MAETKGKKIYWVLERLTRRWWFYPLFFLIPAIIPPYASRGFDYFFGIGDFAVAVGEALSQRTLQYNPIYPPLHFLILILILLMFWKGNKFRTLFSVLVFFNYLFIILVQAIVETDRYGLVFISELVIWYFIVALMWLFDAFWGKTDYTFQKRTQHRYWVIPLAVFAYWNPDQLWNIDLRMFLTSPSPSTFCMMTTIYLAMLCLIYPRVNLLTLRLTSFVGILVWTFSMVVALVVGGSDGTYWALLHMPLLLVSLYSFKLGLQSKPLETSRIEAP